MSAEARNTEGLAEKMKIPEPDLLLSFAAAEHNLAEGIRDSRERDYAESLGAELHVRRRAEFFARNAAAMDARYTDALTQLRENALTVEKEQVPQVGLRQPQQGQQETLQGTQPKTGLLPQDDPARPVLPRQDQQYKDQPVSSPQRRAQLEQERKQHHAVPRP